MKSRIRNRQHHLRARSECLVCFDEAPVKAQRSDKSHEHSSGLNFRQFNGTAKIVSMCPRRAHRYYFGGAVELTEVESGRMLVALVRTLSLYGCFVKTDKTFRAGTKVMLTITNSGFHFSAMGRIVNQING